MPSDPLYLYNITGISIDTYFLGGKQFSIIIMYTYLATKLLQMFYNSVTLKLLKQNEAINPSKRSIIGTQRSIGNYAYNIA